MNNPPYTLLAVIWHCPRTDKWVVIATFSDTESGLKRAKQKARYHSVMVRMIVGEVVE